jgi:hypothetical protein
VGWIDDVEVAGSRQHSQPRGHGGALSFVFGLASTYSPEN